MMQTKKRKWLRRLKWLGVFVSVLSGAMIFVFFSRFHFSTQTAWPLAQLQWDRQMGLGYDGPRPQIIGHRGSGIASADGATVFGNTHSAIKNGIESGVDWIEIDIRASCEPDSRLVVFHDEFIDDKTNGNGAVAELSLGALKEAVVGADDGERILTLDEVFRCFGDRNKKWILDVKVTGLQPRITQWLDQKIEDGQLGREQIIIFGEFDVLLEYRDSGYALGYTVIWGNPSNRLRILFNLSSVLKRCQMLNCKILVLPVIFSNHSLVRLARSKGFDVWVYGVEDLRDFNCLAERGVCGFIVDQPAKFVVDEKEAMFAVEGADTNDSK